MSGSGSSDYNAIAGFDTSSLPLDVAAMENGSSSSAIAAAVYANLSGAARFTNGVALIEAVAADEAGDGVTAAYPLVAFAHQLTLRDGDTSHIAAIGAEIAALVAAGTLGSQAAEFGISAAVSQSQITRTEGLQVALAMAANGQAARAGLTLGDIVTSSSESGAGLTASTAITAINNAMSAGTLSQAEGYGMLAGAIVGNNSRLSMSATTDLRTLIGSDANNTHLAIDALAVTANLDNGNYISNAANSIIAVTTTFGSTSNPTLAQLLGDVHDLIASADLSVANGVSLMLRVGYAYDSFAFTTNTLVAVATAVVALIDDGVADQATTMDAFALRAVGFGATTAAQLLLAAAGVDAAVVYSVGHHIAGLVDTTHSTLTIPNSMMTAHDAAAAIMGAYNTGTLSAAGAVAVFAAMAVVPGGVTPDRNALNVAADSIRSLLSGAIAADDAVSTVVGALGPLGLSAAQGITILVGLGGSGDQQLSGGTLIYVGNTALAAAAASAIAGLIHDNGLSATAIGQGFDSAFPLGVDSAWLALSTIVQAAVALQALDSHGLALIGAALALSDGASPYAMSGVSNGLLGGTFDSDDAIAMVVGYASEGSSGEQVAAGRELSFILNQHFIAPADGVAEIASAVTTGLLTHAQAILLLAGAATATPLIGLSSIVARAAVDMDADPTTGVATIVAAVASNDLGVADGVFVLAEIESLGSAQTASAATQALLSWVDADTIAAGDLATQLLGLAAGTSTALQAVAGATIEALIDHGALTTADALALIGAAVPSTLGGDAAIVVLVHLSAAGDAALQEAVQTEIGALISSGALSTAAAIADLQALQSGASAALAAVLDDELGILLINPSTLADTAGLGSPAQVQAAAVLLASLFTTDPTTAQGVLDALSGRIEDGGLTGAQAATLLAKTYALGGAGESALLAAITGLTTIHAGQSAPDIALLTMADAIAAQETSGALTAAEAFVVFSDLSTRGSVTPTVVALLASGTLSVTDLDTAITAGQFSASNGVSVLASVVPGGTSDLRTAALAEIQALVTATPALAAQAQPVFEHLAINGDHDTRLVGYQAIEALAAVAPGIGDDAFLNLLSLVPLPDASLHADTLAELTSLLAGGYVTASGAISHIADQLSLSNGSPLINASQALAVLVALSAVEDQRSAIYNYIGQVTAATAAAQANGTPVWGFTAAAAITALADAGADSARIVGTAEEIASIGVTTLTTSQILSSLNATGAATSAQHIALVAEVGGFLSDAGAPAQFGLSIGGLIAGLSAADQRASLDGISGLVGDLPDHLTATKAVQFLLAVYSTGAKAAVLAELGDIANGATAAGGVATAIVGAMVSGRAAVATGVDVLAALSVEGGSGLGAAVAPALETALVAGSLGAAAVMSALEGSITDGTLSAAEAVHLLQDVLVARFEVAVDPSDTAALAATATLQSAVLGEIGALMTAGEVTAAQAISAMADAASGASGTVLQAIGGEVATFLEAHSGSQGAVSDGIVAEAAAHAITGAEAATLLAYAAAGASAFQVAAGEGIADLVADGATTAALGAVAVYNAYLAGDLTLDGLVAITAGAWANGGTAVGADMLWQVASHNFETMDGLAASLATAVSAGTLTAADMVQGGIAVAFSFGATIADGAVVLSTVISQGLMTADAVVAQLGDAMAGSILTASQAVSFVAQLAADLPASEMLLGVGLADLVGAGQLSFSDIGTGLAAALSAMVLDFSEAATLLIGAATTEAAAVDAGATLIALIGSDSQHFADTIAAIDAAANGGTLAAAEALSLLAGLANAGSQSQQLAVGGELAALVGAGLATIYTVGGALMAAAQDGHLSGSGAILAMLPLLGDSTSVTYIAGNVNGLVNAQVITASDATGVLVSAVHDAAAPLSIDAAVQILIDLAENHVQTPDGADVAFIVAAGAALASLVSSGDVTAEALLGHIDGLPAFGALPLLAAIEAAAGPTSALGLAAEATLVGYLDDPAGSYALVHYVSQLIGPGGLTPVQVLPILVAMHGLVPADIAIGEVFGSLLAAHDVTMNDVHAALVAADASSSTATMILAAMFDPSMTGTIPAGLLREIVASLHEAPGTTDYSSYVDPLITLLSNAVLHDDAIVHANGLQVGQAVLALAAYAELGDTAVRQDVATAIASLTQQYAQGYDGTFALLAKSVVSLAASSASLADDAGVEIAYVGIALGLTAGQLANAVVAGFDHGLTAAEIASTLAYITVTNPAIADFNGPVPYPNFGLAAGIALSSLVGDDLTAVQALDILLGVTGTSETSQALLLVGFASGVSGADQILVGQALAQLTAANLSSALSLIPDDISGMVTLGLVESGSATGVLLVQNMSEVAITALVASLDASVTDGSVSAADAVHSLALLAGTFGARSADLVLFPRAALAGELVALVPAHISAADAIAILLTPPSGVTGSAAVVAEAEAGALIAALVGAGRETAADVAAAIAADVASSALAPAIAAAIIGGAALYHDYSGSAPASYGLAVALGDALGAMVDAGRIGVSDAMNVAEAVRADFAKGYLPGEVALLAGVAGHGAAGLQAAVGQVLATVYESGDIQPSAVFTVFDALVGTPGALTAPQAETVLLGMADAFDHGTVDMGGLAAVAAEFSALIGRGALSAQTVIGDVIAEADAGHLTMPHGLALLAYLAVADATLTAGVVSEIAGLISGGALTAQQTIDGLLTAPQGGASAGIPDAPAATAVAHIIEALHEDGIVTDAQAAGYVTAAEGQGTLSLADAAAVLVGLADGADETGMAALGDALGTLVGRGIDADGLHLLLSTYGLEAGLIQPAAAVSLVAYVMGAISSLSNADDYERGLASVLAETTAAVAVAAVDRAFDAGGIGAAEVVALLAYLQDAAGVAATIAPELLKMADQGGLTFTAIFDEVGPRVSSLRQGQLVAAMAQPEDAAGQIAVAHGAGAAIAAGSLSFDNVLAGLDRTALGDDLYLTLTLGIATGDAATATAIGHVLSPVLGSGTDLNAALLHVEAALTAGVLTAAQLVQVLAGLGARDVVSDTSASTYMLDSLVSGGLITAAAAMTAVEAAASSLTTSSLVHWLASASASSALHDAIVAEIGTLIDDGALTGTQALGYVSELIQAQHGISIGWPTAASLFVAIAGHGDAALQEAVGAQFAVVAQVGSQYLAIIDTAVTDGSLSGEGAAHVIGGLLAALTSDSSSTVRGWAASHLDGYVEDGLVSVATVSSALLAASANASAKGLLEIGGVMAAVGAGISTFHDAVANGVVTAEHGLELLLGVTAVLDIGDPTFQAARDEIVAMVQAGSITVAQVLAATQAAQDASLMDESHVEVLAFSLFGRGGAADDAAIGAFFANQVGHLGEGTGAATDPFFTDILDETGLTFLDVQAGSMTAAQAIAHIEEYAAAHGVSAYAGIYALDELFSRYQNGDGHTLAHQTLVDLVATGELAQELAGRVAQGSTSAFVSDGHGSFVLQGPDPDALSHQDAFSILNAQASLAYLPADMAQARYVFADDLWVAQQARIETINFTLISSIIDGMRVGNPTFNPAADVGRTAYAYDLALTSLVERLASPDRPTNPADMTAALTELSGRVISGVTASTLIQNYAAGLLTFDQVLQATDSEAAAAALGPDGTDGDIMQSIALAWLQLRGREYVVDHPGTDGAITVGQLLLQLQASQYVDHLLTGFGAILGMSSSGAGALVTTLDKQTAYSEAFYTISSHTAPNLTISERDQAVIDALTTAGNGMAYVLDKHPLGRSYVAVLDDPSQANAWAQFGTQIGIVAANKAAVDALFAGTPWGLALTTAKFGAQAGLYVLSMGAVQDALGEGPTEYLHGQLTVASATASLLGDTISDLGTAGSAIAISMAPHFISFSNAVESGDAAGLASSVGDLAMDYYKLQTGVDPRLYGAVGERFGTLIVDLFTGNTGALGDDVKALGSAYLDLVIQNPYLHAIGDRMVQYAETINGALAEINDSYRILGQNVLTGLLYVGTGFDAAGNVLRSVAHTVGGFFSDVLHGLGIDGYISGATVFADANYNGVLDPGELWTTTDANGHYTLANTGAPLVLQGGIDTATNLAFSGMMQAPAGSTAVTPLTTLIQKVAAAGSGDPVAAQQAVTAALGLPSNLDLNDLDPIAATQTGASGGASAFAHSSSVLNTVAMLTAVGAHDPFAAIADQIAAAAASQRTLDLTDLATIAGLVAAAGVTAGTADAVTQLITASNAMTAHALATASDPLSFLQDVSAVSIAAQGDTSHALAAAGSNPAALADVVARYTGDNLVNEVGHDRDQVGHFGDGIAGGGEVPLTISLDGRGIELATGGAAVAGNWVKLDATDSHQSSGVALMAYAVDSSGNLISRADHHAGSDVTIDQAVLATIGGVTDDHGHNLFMGSQSVYLRAGEELRFALVSGDHAIDMSPDTQLSFGSDGWLQANIGGLQMHAMTNNAQSDSMTLAAMQRSTDEAFLYLTHGETLTVEVAGSSLNTNTLGFVHFDINAATGAWSVAGVAYGNTQAFSDAVRGHMDAGFQNTSGGDFHTQLTWSVDGTNGYYAPVLITQSGDVFVVGNANPGGHEQIRLYGENTFGFEDLAYNQGSDYDFNDMVAKLTKADHIL